MNVTNKTKAIVLRREPFNENNSRVFLYTQEFGKVDLVARGTNKLSSKLLSHIEPLNLCDIMIITGKQYDYLGSCVSEEVFADVKADYDKSVLAGTALRAVDEMIRGRERDERIFLMLKTFLTVIAMSETTKPARNAMQSVAGGQSRELLQLSFTLKLIAMLGYAPKLEEGRVGGRGISKDAAELMTLLLQSRFEEVSILTAEDTLAEEVSTVINEYQAYVFD